MPYPSVQLTQPLQDKLRQGHPWIYADAVRHRHHKLSAGDVVDVVDATDTFVGRGIIEPDSPVRVRLWTTQPDVHVDDALLEQRIKQARRRRPFPMAEVTTGFRLLNGEGDRTPGLVCDIYGEVAVLRPDGVAAERWLEPARVVIARMLPIRHWVIRRSTLYATDAHPVAEWWGEPASHEGARVPFLEGGLQYECDVIQGQKTGFFLDQRANRARLGALSAGRRVLNLFGYTGGFSLAAAAAGAAATTTVDLAAPAIAQAMRHFELNGLAGPQHEGVVSDVFAYLERFEAGKAPFEVVICDPPSFAHKRRDLARARGAYVRLFAKVLEVMPVHSVIALASCSSHVDRVIFGQIVAEAQAAAGVELVLSGVWGADVDHPFLAGFPEGDYLQCAIGTRC